MKNKTPDIFIDFQNTISEEFMEYCILDFYRHDLNLQCQKSEQEPYSSFEWIIPTAIVTYIFKSYFETFLKEMAKDHYVLLKEGLKKMANSGKLVDSEFISASASKNKLSQSYNQSAVFSIIIQTQNNKQIKLLFDNNLDKKDWDEAIDKILDFVIEHYEKNDNDKLLKLIEEANPRDKGMLYALIDPNTKEIEFCDDNKLLEIYK